jgi:uncharacterized HAD superfamily protein
MIAFDLDDVIIDITPVLKKPIKKLLNYDVYAPKRKFKYLCPSYSDKQIKNTVTKILLCDTLKAKPCFYSLEILKQVYENNPIIFITARPKDLEKVTYQWLDLYLDVPYEVFFSKRKEEILLDYNIKYFVEDRYKTAIRVSEICKVYLVNQVWNVGRETLKHNIVRINTLKEINLEDL